MLAPIQHLKMHRFSWPVLDMTMGQQSPVAERPSVARGTSRPISSCQCGLGGRAGGMWTGAELAAVSCQLAVRCQTAVSQMWDASQLPVTASEWSPCLTHVDRGEAWPFCSSSYYQVTVQFKGVFVSLCICSQRWWTGHKNAKQLFIKCSIISIFGCLWKAKYLWIVQLRRRLCPRRNLLVHDLI